MYPRTSRESDSTGKMSLYTYSGASIELNNYIYDTEPNNAFYFEELQAGTYVVKI